jgi:thymidylate synthase
VVAEVDAFFENHDTKRIETVANTIFPEALYRRYGAPAFFERFRDNVLPKVRSRGKKSWSGYYLERKMQLPQLEGEPINQLTEIIGRLKDPNVRALNKFELSVFDPTRDVDGSPYGGQCLSFASFKLIGDGNERRLALTAMYRNHYYIEKLLGNLIGLGRLLQFVGEESGIAAGSLTVLSTHATVDVKNGKWNRDDINTLLANCDQANALALAA